MLDDLRALAVFAKVAELGSFRGAAHALGLSPSVVSHHVQALEARLGLPLLYRSTRRLALTPDGARLVVSAQAMVAAAAAGLDMLSGVSEQPTGKLRLTAPAFMATTTFCADLAAFADAHPKVELIISFTDSPKDLLRDGLDLALRMGDLDDSTHRVRKVAQMNRVLVAAPSYCARHLAPQAPADLAAWTLLHLTSRPPELTLIAPGKKAAVVSAPIQLSTDSAASLRGLALAGAGMAALAEVLVHDDIQAGRLVALIPPWRPAAVGVYLLWPENHQRAALTQRAVAFLAPRLERLFSP